MKAQGLPFLGPASLSSPMANRAYLYPCDNSAGRFHDAWPEDYYDSRWNLPLAWFFFYRPADVHLIEHEDGGGREVLFSAEKDAALRLFAARRALLDAVLGGRLGGGALDALAAKQVARPGRYLVLDPSEVAQNAENDAPRYRDILELLGGDGVGVPAAPARAALLRESGEFFDSSEGLECQVAGWTYS